MTDPTTGDERRRHTRVTAKMTVRSRPLDGGELGMLLGSLGDTDPKLPALGLKKSKQGWVMASTNLSTGGLSATGDLQVIGDTELAKGGDLMIEVDMNDGEEPLRAIAQVMWSAPAEGGKFLAGMMFVIISESNLERIRRQVAEAVARGEVVQ